ncbi:MAG TPA: MotB family protein [Gammaproteobacteria bacterium]|nr:MotB family protein [Gammaproteobacteria bacterium]
MFDPYDDAPRSSSPPPWIITFADLMVLLMCFFVLMLSFSEMDAAKFKLLAGSMNEAFGVQTDVNVKDPPKGTSTTAQEFSPAVPEPTDQNEVRQNTVDSDLDTLDLGLEQRLAELKAQEEQAEQQAQRLRDVFRQEIDDGRLLIRHDGTDVVIQIMEKDSFASGSADLEPGSAPTLAKIGELVASMRGAITVSGHTDNVPIRNGAYRSNWELSAARAATVGHRLLDAGLAPERLMVSGHADTQPRAPNDTPANRALNRRVDITFLNGKDRHDGWAEPPATPKPAGTIAPAAPPVP